VIGKRGPLELVLLALLSDGHVLLEDSRASPRRSWRARSRRRRRSSSRASSSRRTSCRRRDGSQIFDQRTAEFVFRPGPVFANLLLADEINRAPPKTQAALLEAMQERQVTIENETHRLAPPFLVLATQNPIEYEGTYPLPEAQLDRFLVRISVGYPAREDEIEMLQRRLSRGVDDVELEPVVSPVELVELQRALEDVHVSDAIEGYIVDLVAATRESSQLAAGASPRGSIALLKLSRAKAALAGRDFVTPEDVKAIAIPALGHRLTLRPELWVQRLRGDDVVARVLDTVPTPPAEDAVSASAK
jgi:MoxR-like ATPase